MAVKYKQKCAKCRTNYVIVTYRNRYAVCYECQESEMTGEIKDPKMKKMFNVPEEFYKESSFLRDIKINYLKWGKLSEKQIAAFKKVVEKMKETPKDDSLPQETEDI